MQSAEEHLAKKELGDPTRQAQEDALKGLDSLIDLAQNPPDDPDNQDKKPDDNAKPDDKNNKPGNQGAKPDDKNNKPGNQGDKPDPSSKPDASRTPGAGTGPAGRPPHKARRARRRAKTAASPTGAIKPPARSGRA